MSKLKIAIIGCGERGITIYGSKVSMFSDEVEVVAIADPDEAKIERAINTLNISRDVCYPSAEVFFAQEKMADAVLICTQDRFHVKQAIMAIEAGCHVLLEKPISPDMDECRELVKIAEKHKKHVIVAHVLRYTQFYRTIKKLIDSKKIGEVVTIQAIENVAYWHQAHSFVRGNWGNSKEASPMILAKCCHDMDILAWLTGKKCKSVSSYGSRKVFRSDKAPEGATKRCLDGCKAKSNCPYDAEKLYVDYFETDYLNGQIKNLSKTFVNDLSKENVLEAIKVNDYGRCVYHCDNDVVDNQVVNLLMEDDVTINFTMCAFTEDCYREIKIMGSMGEIKGDMQKNTIQIQVFGGESQLVELDKAIVVSEGHGGGDTGIFKEFVEFIGKGESGEFKMSTIDESVESHYIATAAEESRVNNGISIDISKYR